MGLPTSRNTTYAVGSQVKHVDLNQLQDDDIAHEARLNGQRTIVLGLDAFRPQTAADWGLADQGESGSSGGTGLKRSLAGTTVSYVYAYLPLTVGDRLVSYKLDLLEPDTGHRTQVAVQRVTMADGLSNEAGDGSLSAGTVSTGGPGVTTVSFSLPGSGRALAARERLQLAIQTNKVGVQLFGLEIVVDHP